MQTRAIAVLFMGFILQGCALDKSPVDATKDYSMPQPPETPDRPVQEHEGIVDTPSNHSVDETVNRLKIILQSKKITLFALIDHSGEAAKVGMKMPPTKLLIFGNPKGGTPLMLAAPSIALDLPLKILVDPPFVA